jgi:mitochondrial translocator assembly and maintenance protein 41
MTFRVIPVSTPQRLTSYCSDNCLQSILGKRRLVDVYHVAQFLVPSTPEVSRLAAPLVARNHASLTEHKTAQNNGPPPGYDNSNGRKRTESSSTAKSNASPGSAPDPSHSSTRLTTSSQSSAKSDPRSLDAADWDQNPDLSISEFSELPQKNFGVNQHMIINEEFKEALRQILWKFKAPIRYAFAYGSGVFTQKGGQPSSSRTTSNTHPNPPEAITKVQAGGQKMIDFIFGVSYSQHWHSLNLQEHRDHYSAVGSLGSYATSKLQDSFGAGVYFNPYIMVNGTLIKYGVVNIDTLCRDLSQWDTLYLAGRLQKPVKILRDHPSVRLANQVNLISAVRTALLLLPPDFTEEQLYATIAGISYMGDPRMSLPAEDPKKVLNIVQGQLPNFRRLYAPLIENLPNISFNDPVCTQKDWFDDPSINARLAQDMDPVKRGNMVRRLPKKFRDKLYFEYQAKFEIPRGEFNKMLEDTKDDENGAGFRRQQGGWFEQRIAKDTEGIQTEVRQVIEKTIRWPSIVQTVKGIVTAGPGRSWRYAREKREKHLASEARKREEEAARDVTKKEGDQKKEQ